MELPIAARRRRIVAVVAAVAASAFALALAGEAEAHHSPKQPAPYADDSYASGFDSMLFAKTPYSFSTVEAELRWPSTDRDRITGNALWRMRVAAKTLPPLPLINLPASGSWSAWWRVTRRTNSYTLYDTKLLHLGAFIGNITPNAQIAAARWVAAANSQAYGIPDGSIAISVNLSGTSTWVQAAGDGNVTMDAAYAAIQSVGLGQMKEVPRQWCNGYPLYDSSVERCYIRWMPRCEYVSRFDLNYIGDWAGEPYNLTSNLTYIFSNFNRAAARAELDAGCGTGLGEDETNRHLDPSYPSVPDDGANGGATHGENPAGEANDPVNTATGAFVTRENDVELPGIGVPFAFRRVYVSSQAAPGELGPGWTHSYAASLSVAANGDVTLYSEDGQQLLYRRQADGTFDPPAYGRSRLAAVTDGYELVRRDQTVYRFSASGKLLSILDRNGQGLSFAYGPDGLLSIITDSVGRTITVAHDASGHLTGLALSDGRSITYGYTSGLLTSATDVTGGTTTYRYDAQGRLDRVTDPYGHVDVENVYGADGRVIEQRDGEGQVTRFAWDWASQTATITDARANEWQDVYSGNVLVRRIDPLGSTTRFFYDGELNVVQVVDPRGDATTMTYDDRGNLLTRTAPAPLGYQETFAYDNGNNLLSATDGRGATTNYEYDSSGNLIRITRPDPDGPGPVGPVVTEFTRDPSGTGLLESITDPRGKTTSFEHDAFGQVIAVTRPSGAKTTFTYDAAGRVASRVDARGNVAGANPDDYRTTFTYDPAGRLLTETNPLGETTTRVYDPAGNPTTVTDAENRATGYAYDLSDRLTSVTAADGSVTSYAYDGAGNIVTRTDPNNHTTTFEYDAASRLAAVVTPLGRRWTYGYDANGNRTSVVDGNGNATPTSGDGQTTYGYDALNRVVSIDYSDTTPDVQYGYDANSNRIAMNDGAGATAYTYDPLDRPTGWSRGADSISYAYDPAGNITQRSYPSLGPVDYGYDDDGLLVSIARAGTTTTYAYDPAANLTATALANGYTASRSYDGAGRVTQIEHASPAGTLWSAAYTYDAVGNPTTVTGTDGTSTYAYDGLHRLTEACFAAACPGASDPFIRYSYDGVGNRLSEARPAGTTAYAYDADDQLVSVTGPGGATAYGFDANGNQTQAGSRTFAWDLANRLRSTSDGTATSEYGYDGDGVRVQVSSAGVASSWLWDGMFGLPELVLERDGAGATVRGYVHGHGPVSMSAGGAESFFGLDAIGSVVNVTSAAGALEWELAYDPFGGERIAAQAPGAAASPLRFAGEYLDPETGLYHLRARQYDPQTGRFLGLDPLPPTVTDPYVASHVYVRNRPTVLIDPSGWGPVWATNPCEKWYSPKCFAAWATESPVRKPVNPDCSSFFSPSCWAAWAHDDPVRNITYPILEAAAGAAACVEGAGIGLAAGPLGAAAGCVAVTTAFVIGSHNVLREAEDG